MPRTPESPPIQCRHFSYFLRQKRSGVWFADGRHNKGYEIGKPSLSTKDREEAESRLHELDAYYGRKFGLAGKSNDPKKRRRDLKLAHGWDLYLDRCKKPQILGGVSEGTRKRYQAVMEKHLAYCNQHGILYWSQVTKATTRDYGDWLAKQGYADNTLVLELNLICAISKWHVEEKRLSSKCRFYLKMAKPGGTTTYCYNKQQVCDMIQYCQKNEKLVWLGRVIVGLATTGMRINELAGLRWSDLDMDAETIFLPDESGRPQKRKTGSERRLKNRKGRSIPMHADFRKTIESIPRNSDGLVFRAQLGGRLRSRIVLKALQDDVIATLKNRYPTPPGEVGFESGTVHGLRHYFCSEAYRSGATDAELLAWLGHSESNIMQRYRHLRKEDGHRRMRQINFFDGDGEEGDN